MKHGLLLPFLGLVLLGSAWADTAESIPDSSRDCTLQTLDGRDVQPLKCGQDSFAVVIFISTDCPVANAYAPEIRRLYSFIAEQGGKLTLAYVYPELSVEEAAQHAQDYDLKGPLVIDRKHELVTVTGATITPEAALVDPNGHIVYRGRISDLFAGFGQKRRNATTEDLKLAITHLLQGKSPPKARTEAIGCYIPEL